MRLKMLVATMCVAAAGFVGSSVIAAPAEEGAREKAVAEKIVTEVAGVKEKDLVVVRGNIRDYNLLEDISLEVLKQGAHPLQIVGREEMARRYFKEVPARYDAISRDLDLKLAEIETVEILVGGQDSPGLLKDVPAARRAAVGTSFVPVNQTKLKRGVRMVFLGNGLYPTEATAKQSGLKRDQLAEIFWSGIDVDHSKLQATGDALKAALAKGKMLHITNDNGTDLKVSVQGRPAFTSDGIISPEDAEKGGPAVTVYLPAGEVYLAPVPGTAEGKVVVDRMTWADGEIEDLTWTFEAGRLTSLTAKPGPAFDLHKSDYDAAPEGRDLFGGIDFGINPNVKTVPGSKLLSWVMTGMVTVGIGGNEWAGGSNSCPFGAWGFLPDSTVELDGTILVEKGALKIATATP